MWRWNSQPLMKYGMQAGDFLLSTNILLSGNNYTKVALLFKCMNMGMVNKQTFFTIQDTYCVDTVKDFCEERRNEARGRLQWKDIEVPGTWLKLIHVTKLLKTLGKGSAIIKKSKNKISYLSLLLVFLQGVQKRNLQVMPANVTLSVPQFMRQEVCLLLWTIISTETDQQ